VNAALADWSNFFVAEVGATAALAGLIFVAVSLNLDRMLKYRWLPQRAAQTLAVLIEALILASIGLLPHGTPALAGTAMTVVAIAAYVVTYVIGRAGGRISPEFRGYWLINIALLQVVQLPAIAGGLLLALGRPAGLWLIAATIMVALTLGVLNAWVFLVEIAR
jgi:hypothetical protein